jgi:phage-related protein
LERPEGGSAITVVGEAFIDVKAKTDEFGPATEKGVLGAIGGIAGKAAAVLGGAFAAREVLNFGKDIFAAAEEASKGLAQTENVLKSTGGQAGITAKDVDRLTESLAKKTAIDDDQIRSGTNLLLTFTNIKNEVGDGNDIFNQANGLMVDLAKAMGTDVKGGAIQLGKALNDPVAGITALTRVGVSFTQQQKDQIAAMVEAGDVAGAQKIILAELNKEFGGSAAAQATAADRAKQAWGEFQEELGGRLMPVVETVAGFLSDNLPRALDFVSTVATGVGQVVATVVDIARSVLDTLQSSGVLGIMSTIASFVADNLQPILIGVAAAVLTFLVPAFVGWAISAGAAAVATLVAAAPVIALGLAIAGLVAGIVYAYQHFEIFRTIVDTVITFMTGLISGFVDLVLGLWHTFGDEIVAVVQFAFGLVQTYVETVLGVIQGIIAFVMAVIQGDWGAAWQALKDIASSIFNGVVEFIGNALELAKTLFSGALGTIVSTVSNKLGELLQFFAELPGRILGAVGDLGEVLYDAGRAIIRGLLNGIKAAVGEVYDFVKGIAGKIASLKGPIDKDKRLLIPAGVAIMRGLEAGIASQQDALEARLRDITSQIEAVGGAGVAAAGASDVGASSSALVAQVSALAAAIQALAQGGAQGGSWNVTGTDPVAASAAMLRQMNWGAGR